MLTELKKKRDLIEKILKLKKIQAKNTFHIASLVEEFKDMNSNFGNLEADIVFTKCVSNKQTRLRQCW